ncbi:hypothetical protein DERP_002025 [Dermatophagoides pteronyssinus]|uniref:Uncharacterized protein n=1 Tax=Dermatophagoides pteronyssinus TaxID=6956 RepID=A0ABQ8JGL1_DERPT|nr:hypothetical protein DERP_002025 [Dermatophagoides pteronyssinus]
MPRCVGSWAGTYFSSRGISDFRLRPRLRCPVDSSSSPLESIGSFVSDCEVSPLPLPVSSSISSLFISSFLISSEISGLRLRGLARKPGRLTFARGFGRGISI